MAQPILDPVAAAEGSVAAAASVDEATARLRDALSPVLPADRVTVIVFEDLTTRFAGTSDDQTFYTTGTEVAYGLTDDVTRILSGLLLGKGAIIRFADHDIGLLGLPLEDEGLAVAVAAPLFEGEVVLGAIAASSRDPNAYGPEHVDLLERVARAIQGSLLRLAGLLTD